MRTLLQALTDELLRLKTEGVQTVVVTDQALAELRTRMKALYETKPKTDTPTEPTPPPGPPLIVTSTPSVLSAPAISEAPTSKSKPSEIAKSAATPPPPDLTLPAGSAAERWAWLKREAETHPFCRTNLRPGHQPLLGSGALDAKIFFLAESPSAEECAAGALYQGPAGELLAKMIRTMGLTTDQVFLCNLVCWRPQSETAGPTTAADRAPNQAEAAFGLAYVKAALEIVNPTVIVCLGRTASEGLLGTKLHETSGGFSSMRGRWQTFQNRKVMVTFHPNYLEKNGTKAKKRLAWEDLLQVMDAVGLPVTDKQRSYFL